MGGGQRGHRSGYASRVTVIDESPRGELAATTDGAPTAGRWRLTRAALAEAVVGVALLVSTLAVLGWHADDQDFSIDESRWIATSRYFWITIIDRDLFGPDWRPNYIVLTHPPVARYLIGFGLWLQGWTPEQLNGRYDTFRSRDYNRQQGNIPGPDLLDAARRVVLVSAVGATMLLYPIGRLLGGPVAGAAAVGLALANPLLATLWTRALAESILAFFCLLAFLLAALVARAGRGRPPYAVALALGALIGLSVATKLTGVFVALAVGMFVLVQRAAFWRADRRWPGPGVWLDAMLGAILIFVVVNPLLYPNPVMRTAMLFEHRRDEMLAQAQGTPRLAVPPEIGARAALMYQRTFAEFGTVQAWTRVPADALLAAIALGVVALSSWRSLRQAAVPGPSLLLLTWIVATYVISTVNLGFNSSHYFALPVLLAVLLEAVALAALVSGAVRIIARLLERRRPASTPPR